MSQSGEYSKTPKVLGFEGSRVRGFEGSRVRGFEGSKVRRFEGSKVPEFAVRGHLGRVVICLGTTCYLREAETRSRRAGQGCGCARRRSRRTDREDRAAVVADRRGAPRRRPRGTGRRRAS